MLCQAIPAPIRERRRVAMVSKAGVDRQNPEWRDQFFDLFPELECPTDEEESSGEMVAVSLKRKSLSQPGAAKKAKAESSATVSVNPNKDADGDLSQGLGVVGPDHTAPLPSAEQADDECQIVGVVPAESVVPETPILAVPVEGQDRMKVMEDMLRTLKTDLHTLTQANLLRDQQEDYQEDEEVKTRLSSLEKRSAYLNMLKEISPELVFPEHPLDTDREKHFGDFVSKGDKCLMPFCDELLNQIAIKSRPSAHSTKREPFRWIDRFYKTMPNVEQALFKPRVVPAALISEVNKDQLANDGASGNEARLKPDKACGQREVDALRDTKQASSLIRIVNNQELGLRALGKLSTTVNDALQCLTAVKDLPAQFSTKFEAMQHAMTNVASTLEDMRLGNFSMAKALIHKYVEAIKERRQAWITSSSLPKGLQGELNKAPLDILQAGADEPLLLLDGKSVQILDDNAARRDKVAVRLAVAGRSNPPQGASARGRKKRWGGRPGNQKPVNWNDLTPAAQTAGWSTSQQNNSKRGGHGGKPGRGRGRGQPFSGANASKSSK
jgi:hypothetical protein